MRIFDPRFADHAAKLEASETSRSTKVIPIIRTPNLPKGSASSETTAFHFVLKFPRRGSAVRTLNWVLAALETHCAPTEEVDFEYSDTDEVTATVYVGNGWGLPNGFQVFLSLMQTSPSTPAFGWSIEMLPHYSHITARAVEDPQRFEQIGEHLSADLIARKELHIQKVRCPCSHVRDHYRGDDSIEERARTAGVLVKLRDGVLRWRRGGAS